MVSILTTASTVTCPHGGQVSLSSSQAIAKIDGSPVLLQTDEHAVSGCPFQKPITPPVASPCVTVKWLTGSTLVKVNGVPVLLQSSVGLCSSGEQIPQGNAIVTQTQSKARGS